MIFRNVIFQLEVIKQRLSAGLVSHHGQASKANREQQHRVLWPAYNPNLATRQASTKGLFQQTRLLSIATQRFQLASGRRSDSSKHPNFGWIRRPSSSAILMLLV